MFECIGTGKNSNYGKKGQVIHVNDNYVLDAIKYGWVTNKIRYLGHQGFEDKKKTIRYKEMLIPYRKRDLMKRLESQNRLLIRLIGLIEEHQEWLKKYGDEGR